MRASTPASGCPWLFVSGYDEGAVLGIDRVPDHVSFLAKPFAPSTLHSKVREVIDA
jgi:hypothetical protein